MRLEPGLGWGMVKSSTPALELKALDPECSYPTTQNSCIDPIPEKENANPNSQIKIMPDRNKSRQTLPSHPSQTWMSLAVHKFPTGIAKFRDHTCIALQ